MSKLEELEESLYGKDDTSSLGRGRRAPTFPASARKMKTSWGDILPRPGLVSRLPISKMTIMALIAGVLFVVGAGVFALLYLGSERREARVTIEGREEIEGGEVAVIPVSFRNISSEPLEDADLIVEFPADTWLRDESGRMLPVTGRVVRRIGTLEPDEEQRLDFSVQFFGREGDEKPIQASLVYRPTGLRARFSAEVEKKIRLVRVPLAIAWDIPETVTPGQETEIALRVSSTARTAFEGLALRLDFPPGFTVTHAPPTASSTANVWLIGTLVSGEEKKISLKGSFSATAGDVQSLRAGIGTFNELTKEWKPWQESVREVRLSASPFLLEATIGGKREGMVKPGDFLSIVVRYQNRSTVPVKNITVRTALDMTAIDSATLSIGDGGIVDFATKNIVWGPGSTGALREVAPGQEGILHISARVRPRPAISTSADKNLTIRVRSGIESQSIPDELTGAALNPGDTITFKVSTVVLVSGRTVYHTSPLPNTGPLPPRVGEKTVYTIVWEVRNFTNDVEGAELRASLPPNVRWEGPTFPSDADVRFDKAASEVRWRLGRVAAGTGVLNPGRVAAFQVSLVPAENDRGTYPSLTGSARFSGRDMFTAEDITLEMSGRDTQMPDDSLVKSEEWAVAR